MKPLCFPSWACLAREKRVANLPPGVSLQRLLVASSLENPSSVTTNPTP